MLSGFRPLLWWAIVAVATLVVPRLAIAQSTSSSDKSAHAVSASALERDFFSAIRTGDSNKVLSYIPQPGVNVGPQAKPVSREEIAQQFRSHRGLYCKLFDSSCISATIELDDSRRSCSYRELLTHSKKLHTAASELTRNGVRQAVLLAEIQNDKCPKQKLIDIIFNFEADGWKLFSIP
jgi:hypothetical protein